jgi:eukaryotic-like serine/threonine-protein kinase
MCRAAIGMLAYSMLVLAGFCSLPARAQDWPEFGFSASGTRYNPAEYELGVTTVGKLKLTNKIDLGEAVYSSAAFVSNVAYVGSDYDVYAIGAHGINWDFATSGLLSSSPAVASAIVYVGSYEDLYALDATSGALLWTFSTGGGVYSSPAVSGNMVYFGSADNYVYALNATTGSLAWKYQTGGAVVGSAAVASGIAYISSDDGNLYALNAETGVLVWSFSMGAGERVLYPSIANGIVYAGSETGYLYALDASTGAMQWQYETTAPIETGAAVANGSVYFCSENGGLYSLNAATGAANWSTYLDFVRSSPAVANGVVYAGSYNDKVYAINAATGATLWSHATKNMIFASPTVANGQLIIGSSDDDIYFFALPAGTKAGTTTTLSSSPNPSTYGEAVIFTAVVTWGEGAPPDGETVSFMKGKTVLGTGTLSSGSASFTISTLKVGTNSITAEYSGDSNFASSKSKPLKQVVEKAAN